jgi:hypothetical protein
MQRSIIAVAAFFFLASVGYSQFPQPTKEHEVLKHEVGNWIGKVKLWARGPAADPDISAGHEVIEMVGGLWAVGKFEGKLLGQPFSGRSTFGYDPNTKKYVGFWVDSLSSTPMQMEGTYEATTKTMTISTTGMEPNGDPNQGKMIVVYGDNEKKMKMFAIHDGVEIKVMEVTYTRQE